MSTNDQHLTCKPCVPDWKTAVTREVVAAAVEHMRKEMPSSSSVGNFFGVSEKRERGELFFGQACHALMSSVDQKYRHVICTENGYKRNSKDTLTKEEVTPFLKWFLHHSPYGFITLNRDDFDSCLEAGFVIAGDAPTTLVQCALIISRHFYECQGQAFTLFNQMVARGIDGLIAYQLAFNSSVSKYFYTDLSKEWFAGLPGHRVTCSVTPDILLNMYKGETQNPLGETYYKHPSIYGSSRLFIKDYDYTGPHRLHTYRKLSKEFHEFLLEREGKLDKSGVYKPPNPFVNKPSTAGEYSFTYQQTFTDVADYLQAYVKENLENV